MMNDKKLKTNRKYLPGFGILEVMISALIIITILTALVFIGRSALANSVYVQQKAQATYLAQEAIEQVRQIRDTNWIDGNNATQWDSLAWSDAAKTILTRPAVSSYNIALSGTKYGLEAQSASVLPEKISIPSANGTEYTRTVKISAVAGLLPKDSTNAATIAATDVNTASNSLQVTIDVTFGSTAGDKTISASEVITNWRPNY